MKYRVFSVVVALGLAGTASLALAESPALQQARKAASEVDLSAFLNSRTDARSQSFGFGGTHEHPFSVESSGRYVFTSTTLPGDSEDYRIKATLLDGQGNVIARGEGLGQNGGLRLTEPLEPGDYVLRVTANKFGSEKTGGNSYSIEVAELDTSGQRLSSDESGVDAASGIQFGEPGRDGRTTALVNRNDAVATIAAPRASGAASAVGENPTAARGLPPQSRPEQQQPTTRQPLDQQPGQATTPTQATSTEAAPAPERRFDEIVTDVDIRMRGEVLSFDVAEAGTVSVTSSTFVGSETEYRLEARILDENGNVVAGDKAQGFESDFAIETHLQPGRYTVWVNGQKFGNARSGVNNYTLRIRQLDTR